LCRVNEQRRKRVELENVRIVRTDFDTNCRPQKEGAEEEKEEEEEEEEENWNFIATDKFSSHFSLCEGKFLA
jgi:cellulose biosynthesis protein BcsQ